MPSIAQDYGRMGHFHDTYAGIENKPIVEYALRESTKPIGVS
jgi:hypothetical protein